MGAEGGESMRNSVDGGWPGMLELFAKEASGATASTVSHSTARHS
jgi:hypothetical protein